MWKDRDLYVAPCGLETDCRVFFFLVFQIVKIMGIWRFYELVCKANKK